MGKGRRLKADRRRGIYGPVTAVERHMVRPIDSSVLERVAASDKKQKSPVIGRCHLCGATKALLLSHVLPKWSTRWAKEEGAVIHVPADGSTQLRLQDGLKHYMLCRDCEQYLGQGEDALRRLACDSPAALAQHSLDVRRVSADAWEIVGRKRALVQRGLLGVLLRYHYAPASAYRLPNRSVVKSIRRALLADDYSQLAAPFALKHFAFESLPGSNPRATAGVNVSGHGDGSIPYQCYVELGGLAWYVPLMPGRSMWDLLADSPNGDWTIVMFNMRQSMQYFDDWEAIDEPFGDAFAAWDKTVPCPCGSGVIAGKCCAASWAEHL